MGSVQIEVGDMGPRPWPRLHETWMPGRILSRGDRTSLALSWDPSGYCGNRLEGQAGPGSLEGGNLIIGVRSGEG